MSTRRFEPDDPLPEMVGADQESKREPLEQE